ncbi:MAG: SA1320 family protein [Culicoidibacterales bacterium]
MDNNKLIIDKTLDISDLLYVIEDWANDVNGARSKQSDLGTHLSELGEDKYKKMLEGLALHSMSRDDITGMTAATFTYMIDTNGNGIVDKKILITGFAGTNDKEPQIVKDFAADGGLLFGVNLQTITANGYLQQLITENPDTMILLTGHSLGGGVALDMARELGLSVIIYNGAPSSFGKNWLSMLNGVKPPEFALNFVSEKDQLNGFADYGKWRPHNYWIPYTGGHGLKSFDTDKARKYMGIIFEMEQSKKQTKVASRINVDINGDGVTDYTVIRDPQQFIAKSLFTGGVLVGGTTSKLITINPEHLFKLASSLQDIAEYDLNGTLKGNISIAQQKNDTHLQKYTLRAETATEAIFEQLKTMGIGRVMAGLEESFDCLIRYSSEGQRNISALVEVAEINIPWIRQQLELGPNQYFEYRESRWMPNEFISELSRLKQAANGLLAMIENQQSLDICSIRGKHGIGLAESTGELGLFFGTVKQQVGQAIEGIGKREGLMDGMGQALKAVFSVMEKNVEQAKQKIHDVSTIARCIGENFQQKDEAIKTALAAGKLPIVSVFGVAPTFQAYLEESDVFGDVNFLQARDQQIEIQANKLASYMTENVHEILRDIQLKFREYIDPIGDLKHIINSMLEMNNNTIYKFETETTLEIEKEIKGYDTDGYPEYEDIETPKEHTRKLEAIELGKIYGQTDAIEYMLTAVLPLSEKLQETSGMVDAFLKEYTTTTAYMKVVVESAIYESMQMEDMMKICKYSIDVLTRIDQQLRHLITTLMLNNTSMAIDMLEQHAQQARKLIQYFKQMTARCFGDNVSTPSMTRTPSGKRRF